MTDTERIEAIMADQHLNNVAFCNKVGMNQATLSNILAKRTNPSLQVLRSIVDAFPELNQMWVMLGEGEMKKHTDEESLEMGESSHTPDDLLGKSQAAAPEFSFGQMTASSNLNSGNQQSHVSGASQMSDVRTVMPAINVNDIVSGVVTQLQKPTRKIIEVRIFFDDGTFETFSSR